MKAPAPEIASPRPRSGFWRRSVRLVDTPASFRATEDPPRSATREASFNPHTGALYLPGLRLTLGCDYFAAVRAAGFDHAELLGHELIHLAQGSTPIGMLQKALAEAVYVVLTSLEDPCVLSVPSWRISGNTHLDGVLARVISLHRDINREAELVEETVCTASTLLTVLAHHQRVTHGSRRREPPLEWNAILARSHQDVRDLCQHLRLEEWLMGGAATTEALLSRQVLLLHMGLAALSPSPDIVGAWWSGGRIHAQGPAARFTALVDAFRRTWDEGNSWRETVDLLLQAGVFTEMAPVDRGSSSTLLDRYLDEAERFPDPCAEIAHALGVERAWSTGEHPVAQARWYVMSGFRSSVSVEALERLAPVMPLVVATTAADDSFRCKYEVRLRLGGIASPNIAADPPAVWEQAIRGGGTDQPRARVTVMPASIEARYLHDLDRVFAMLVERRPRLACLCAPSPCPAHDDCTCGTLLRPLSDRIRLDSGRAIPGPACLPS